MGIDVNATGLTSFMQETTDFFGTGIIHDLFQISGIQRKLKLKLKIVLKIYAN